MEDIYKELLQQQKDINSHSNSIKSLYELYESLNNVVSVDGQLISKIKEVENSCIDLLLKMDNEIQNQKERIAVLEEKLKFNE